MPIKRFVVEWTNQGLADDPETVNKAVRSIHNKIYNGTFPRHVIIKLGRDLFIDLAAWQEWLKKKKQKTDTPGPGRPRKI